MGSQCIYPPPGIDTATGRGPALSVTNPRRPGTVHAHADTTSSRRQP